MALDVSFTILTGLSGAGKTQAMKALEDLDFFCIDNLPPALLPRLVELHATGNLDRKFAIAIDIRVQEFFSHLRQALEWLGNSGIAHSVIFLDCNDDSLIKRFSETRRLHPLRKDTSGQDSISDAIMRERGLLSEAREMASFIIDTTELRPMDLRLRLYEIFMDKPLHHSLSVDLFSFGYKYGVPIDADIVFDVRFIPNPFYIAELKPLTGKDPKVAAYVLQHTIVEEFLSSFGELIEKLIPFYSREGKARLTIGIGCTGGQHRSVAIAIELAKRMGNQGIHVQLRHRENRDSPLEVNSY